MSPLAKRAYVLITKLLPLHCPRYFSCLLSVLWFLLNETVWILYFLTYRKSEPQLKRRMARRSRNRQEKLSQRIPHQSILFYLWTSVLILSISCVRQPITAQPMISPEFIAMNIFIDSVWSQLGLILLERSDKHIMTVSAECYEHCKCSINMCWFDSSPFPHHQFSPTSLKSGFHSIILPKLVKIIYDHFTLKFKSLFLTFFTTTLDCGSSSPWNVLLLSYWDICIPPSSLTIPLISDHGSLSSSHLLKQGFPEGSILGLLFLHSHSHVLRKVTQYHKGNQSPLQRWCPNSTSALWTFHTKPVSLFQLSPAHFHLEALPLHWN